MGAGEMGVGKMGVGKMGVGETGIPLIFDRSYVVVMLWCSRFLVICASLSADSITFRL